MKLKKFLSIILSRNAAFVLLLLMQIAFLGVLVYGLRERFYMVYFILIAIDIVLAVFIMNKKEPPAYKAVVDSHDKRLSYPWRRFLFVPEILRAFSKNHR